LSGILLATKKDAGQAGMTKKKHLIQVHTIMRTLIKEEGVKELMRVAGITNYVTKRQEGN
jgi:hypothetical protein